MSFKHHKQMSESFLTAAFLSVSGGLQDAYTYIFRGKVFANAQTGNIVLLSQSIIEKDFVRAIHYLVPLLFFALGIAMHNIPMGMLIDSTMEERKRSERYVLLAAVTLSTLFGGMLMNMIEVHLSEVLTLTMVSIATGMILYIVFSELTPHVFRTREHLRESVVSVIIGFALVWVSTMVA